MSSYHEIPYINICPYEALGRSLKTPGSARVVPLLGIGLWAAKQWRHARSLANEARNWRR
jgi:hypothetical protein